MPYRCGTRRRLRTRSNRFSHDWGSGRSLRNPRTSQKPPPHRKLLLLPHPRCRHSQVGHSQVGQSQVGHSQVGHSQVGHSQVGHSQVGHSQVGHSQVGRLGR
jgi:hypothetical protein